MSFLKKISFFFFSCLFILIGFYFISSFKENNIYKNTQQSNITKVKKRNKKIARNTKNTKIIDLKKQEKKKEPSLRGISVVKVIDSQKSDIKKVYNAAYTENYKPDSIEYIIKNAQYAYILIDPFEKNQRKNISKIKKNNNEVGCYISVGTAEQWRDDFNDLKKYVVKKEWNEWEGEYFLKNINTEVIKIIQQRIDKLAFWGCDWVEFDNMDWVFDQNYRTKYKGEVTEKEAVLYYQALCLYAKSKNLKCMAKNTLKDALFFDGVLYESYTDEKNWWNTDDTKKFLDSGGFVIINHYGEKNPGEVYSYYKDFYGENISFISENVREEKYIHY